MIISQIPALLLPRDIMQTSPHMLVPGET